MHEVWFNMQDRDAERRRAGRRPYCHFFNSFFLNKLYMDERSYSYDAVQRWTLPEKLMQNNQVRTCVSRAWTEPIGPVLPAALHSSGCLWLFL